MTNRIMLLAVFVASVLFSGCSKDDDKARPVNPAPQNPAPPAPVITVTTGSLMFVSFPAMAATRIEIINGTDTIVAFPDVHGVFNVAGIEENNYTINFTPSPIYEKPADVAVVIQAGKVTDLGSIGFVRKPAGISAKANGIFWKPALNSNTVQANGTIVLWAWTYGAYGFDIAIPFETGKFNSVSHPKMWWRYNGIQGGPNEEWSSPFGGSAEASIVEINTTLKRISGTFKFTANASPHTNATGTVTISEGLFVDVPYND